MNKERLLNVAKACRESPNPSMFTMNRYGHNCGTPACALGHYAARGDLQDEFYLSSSGCFVAHGGGGVYMRTLEHFGITTDQEDELFGSEGCGCAETPEEAAKYIEQFVVENE